MGISTRSWSHFPSLILIGWSLKNLCTVHLSSHTQGRIRAVLNLLPEWKITAFRCRYTGLFVTRKKNHDSQDTPPPSTSFPCLFSFHILEIVYIGDCWFVYGCDVWSLPYSKHSKSCEDKWRQWRAGVLVLWRVFPSDTPFTGKQGHCAPIGSSVCGVLRSSPGWLKVPSFPTWRGIVPVNRQTADTVSWGGSESLTVQGGAEGPTHWWHSQPEHTLSLRFNYSNGNNQDAFDFVNQQGQS